MRIKLLLSLLLLFSISFALSFDDIRLALPVIIVIVTGVLALAYSVSQSLNRPQLHSWVKTEIRELIVAAILFVVVLGFFNGGAQSIAYLITGEPDFQVAANRFTGNMKTIVSDSFEDLAKTYHAVGMRASFSTNLAIPIFYVVLSGGGAAFSGFGALFAFLGPATNGLTNLLFFYSALEVLLNFFISATTRDLIYIAFAFRFIPFTRQLGTTLIALVIGAYIIYPFSLVLVNQLHSAIDIPTPSVSESTLSEMNITIPPGSYFICNEWYIRFLTANFGEIGLSLPICILVAIAALLAGGAAFAACWNIMTIYVYPILNIVITVVWVTFMIAYTFVAPNMDPVFEGLKPFFKEAVNLTVVGVIDAILISIITIVGVKSVSIALGGEYMLPGVQKLVG